MPCSSAVSRVTESSQPAKRKLLFTDTLTTTDGQLLQISFFIVNTRINCTNLQFFTQSRLVSGQFALFCFQTV